MKKNVFVHMHYDIPVVLIDDEINLLKSASLLLRSDGFKNVLTINDSYEVLPVLNQQRNKPGVILLDLTMPGLSGLELLGTIVSDFPGTPVIIMTATNEVDTAVQCMQAGAYDYLVKPVDKGRLLSSVHRALTISALQNEVNLLKKSILAGDSVDTEAVASIVTQNTKLLSIFQYMAAIAPSDQPVLITGETGTGKELFAQAIHALSGRHGPLVIENVAGLDEAVFTDTLFGHTKGAFTGADRSREGLVAKAENGTLFLDEIGDLANATQIKLLRLLQERTYFPIGSDATKRTNARIIVATNCDIEELIGKGEFRKDLYYRLHTHHIHIPPLRERYDDLPLLINHFLEKTAQSLKKPIPTAPQELLTLLKTYEFSGNVRELEGLIYNAVAIHQGGVLSLSSFREALGYHGTIETGSDDRLATASMKELIQGRIPTLKEAEQFLIDEALTRSDGNQGIAAGILGITRQALNKRLVRSKKLVDPQLT